MITVITAFIIDFIIGDPRTTLHPVARMGAFISMLERLFYNEKSSKWEHFILGGLLVFITLLFFYNLTLAIVLILEFLPHEGANYVIQGLILSFMICPHSLAKAGRDIYNYLLRHHLRMARIKVGQIVGRDTKHLDSPEVTRATVETIAENTVDGIISPLFFFALGGLPLAVVYRAANTLDSMIGYKNDRYLYFGRVAARVDDVLNYIPARLTGLLLIAVAAILGYDAKQAWAIMRRVTGTGGSVLQLDALYGGYAQTAVDGANVAYTGNTLYTATRLVTQELGGFQHYQFVATQEQLDAGALIEVTGSKAVVLQADGDQHSTVAIGGTEPSLRHD